MRMLTIESQGLSDFLTLETRRNPQHHGGSDADASSNPNTKIEMAAHVGLQTAR